MNNVQKIKSEVPPLHFFREELPSMPTPRRESGWADGGLCPFHDDHRPGSFRVSLDSGAFRCFSCGASGGDIIAFVVRRDGVDFREALDYLKNEWGC